MAWNNISLNVTAGPQYAFRTVLSSTDTIGGQALSGINRAAISNSGALAISVNYLDGGGNSQTAIYTRTTSKSGPVQYADVVDPAAGIGPPSVNGVINGTTVVGAANAKSWIAMNNAGQVAYSANFYDGKQGGADNSGVFVTPNAFGDPNPNARIQSSFSGINGPVVVSAINSTWLDQAGDVYFAAGSGGLCVAYSPTSATASTVKSQIIPGDGSVSIGGSQIYSVNIVAGNRTASWL